MPASGKSTYAKELIKDPSWKRVNKDDLRAMIDDSKWDKEREKNILDARDALISSFLINGYNVVVDDTNFEEKHIERIRDVADEIKCLTNKKVDVEIKFIDTPLYECLERDSKRERPVGKKVIMEMNRKYLGLYREEEIDFDWNENLQPCIICDIDGTLAYSPQRSPYDYSMVILDKPNRNLMTMIRTMQKNNPSIDLVIFSGRDDDSKKQTEEWLDKHDVKYTKLVMRKTGDKRSDEIVKKEMYDKHVKNKYNVLTVFDDRPRVIRMWKEQGLMVCDVNRQDPRIDF